jgi:hypothetical protein
VGPEKVFNEAGSRCCNIIKIVSIYLSLYRHVQSLRSDKFQYSSSKKKKPCLGIKIPRESVKIQNSTQ